MEYCDEGTLEEVSRLGLQEHVIRLYSKQITTAINVLHEHGIVHRDIKGKRASFSNETCMTNKTVLNSLSSHHLINVCAFFFACNRSKYLPHVVGLD